MRKLPIAVFISGSGTNLQALIDAASQPDYPAEIKAVISNRPDAYGIERAKAAEIPVHLVDHKNFDSREAFEAEIQSVLSLYTVDLICLAGFMRILTADFVNSWRDRMINIHPSLLPSYKGLDTHARALEDGVRFAGCTIHYVRPEMDNGPIIMQAAVPIAAQETVTSLADKIHTEEHRMYPAAVRMIAEGHVRVSGRRVILSDAARIPNSTINPSV